VEYHDDDFDGKTLGMMRRGFDLHVHFANFGIRQLMFRLPHGFPGGVTALQPYLIKHQIVWSQDKTGPGGVLQVNPAGDTERWNDYFCDIEDLLKELTPVRELLIQGDLRPLYLAWLACEPPEAEEPPVPAGLKVLPQPLQLMADFYEVRECLIQVAADESTAISETVAPSLPILPWLEKKSEKQRIALLEQLLNDDSGVVRADVLQSIRATVTPTQWPSTKTSRTLEDLLQRAQERNHVLQREKQAAEEEQRRKHLAVLAENPDRIVKKNHETRLTKNPRQLRRSCHLTVRSSRSPRSVSRTTLHVVRSNPASPDVSSHHRADRRFEKARISLANQLPTMTPKPQRPYPSEPHETRR
jgi:hypothetical protein